jgi:DNA repair protein RadC
VSNCAAIILAHNHSSGDPTPSQEDHALTKRLKEGGEILGIPVLDHLVIGDGRYISFADQGWLKSY